MAPDDGEHHFGISQKSAALQVTIYILLVVLMANLSPLVDAMLHPEIPYFDKEHLIVGGVTGAVSIMIFGLLLFHVRRLNKAMEKINQLEMFIPICSNCKRIRIPDSDPEKMESWMQIESYITEKTTTQFSHGICPECFERHYGNPKRGSETG
jgi:hypothetical protein